MNTEYSIEKTESSLFKIQVFNLNNSNESRYILDSDIGFGEQNQPLKVKYEYIETIISLFELKKIEKTNQF